MPQYTNAYVPPKPAGLDLPPHFLQTDPKLAADGGEQMFF
jgi:hypothetical protein